MTVGNQPTKAGIDNSLTSLALQWRNLAQQTIDLNEQIATMGSAGLIAAGYASGDVASVQAFAGNLADIAGIYQGQPAGLTLPFNFCANTYPLWAGQ